MDLRLKNICSWFPFILTGIWKKPLVIIFSIFLSFQPQRLATQFSFEDHNRNYPRLKFLSQILYSTMFQTKISNIWWIQNNPVLTRIFFIVALRSRERHQHPYKSNVKQLGQISWNTRFYGWELLEFLKMDHVEGLEAHLEWMHIASHALNDFHYSWFYCRFQ